jgi:hypothetical protein
VLAINDKISLQSEKVTINNQQFELLNQKLLEDYRYRINEEIKKIDKSAYKGIFNKYIVFLFENQLIRLLNLRQIQRICQPSNEDIGSPEHYVRILGNFVFLY